MMVETIEKNADFYRSEAFMSWTSDCMTNRHTERPITGASLPRSE